MLQAKQIDLESKLAKIRQDAEDLYNKMMKELKLNLDPLEKARELVRTERGRIQDRHDRTEIELGATESSIQLLNEERQSQIEH